METNKDHHSKIENVSRNDIILDIQLQSSNIIDNNNSLYCPGILNNFVGIEFIRMSLEF